MEGIAFAVVLIQVTGGDLFSSLDHGFWVAYTWSWVFHTSVIGFLFTKEINETQKKPKILEGSGGHPRSKFKPPNP